MQDSVGAPLALSEGGTPRSPGDEDGAPRSAVLYDNLGPGPFTITGGTPRTGAADEAFFDGAAARLTSIQFVYNVAIGGPSSFDVRIRFWDDYDTAAVGAAPQFLNLRGDLTIPLTGQVVGVALSNPIDLTGLSGGGVTVTANPAFLGVPNICDVYVQLDFLQPGTTTPVAADGVTFSFDTSGVDLGYTFASPLLGGDGTVNNEFYWRDANTNGTISVDELRLLSGSRANLAMRLEGTLDSASVINYQGRLVLNGEPVNSLADFEFRVFDVSTGGASLAPSILKEGVTVTDGLFSVEFDAASGLFNGGPRWLEIAVASPPGGVFTTLSPRQHLTATPYCISSIYSQWESLQGMPAGFADGVDDGAGADGHSLDASDGAPADAVYVDAAGNIGVWTTTPAQRLDVRGGNIGLDNEQVVAWRDQFNSAIFSTGIRGGKNSLILSTASTERVRINEIGQVGIGTFPSAKLHVGGVSGTDGIMFPDGTLQTTAGVAAIHVHSSLDASDGSPANALALDAVGFVGVGTTAPERRMHLFDGESGSSQGGATNGLLVEDDTDCFIHIQTPDANVKGVVFGSPTAFNHGSIRYSNASGISFRTGSNNERLRIDSAGNVGIGTTTPASLLHLAQSGSPAIRLQDIDAGDAAAPTYRFYIASDNSLRIGDAVTSDSVYFWPGTRNMSIGTGVEGGRLLVEQTVTGTNTAFRVRLNDGSPFTRFLISDNGGTSIGANTVGPANGLRVAGNCDVIGTMTKGGGSFKIDHPLDPENKYLYHSFVESPDMMNIYNGNVVTDHSGYATVTLPRYFEALNMEFRYQLTVVDESDSAEFVFAKVVRKISGNQFTIRTSKPGVEVSWQVTGIRQDAFANANRIQIEVEKEPGNKGRYLHPEVFGKPRERGVDLINEKDAQAEAP